MAFCVFSVVLKLLVFFSRDTNAMVCYDAVMMVDYMDKVDQRRYTTVTAKTKTHVNGRTFGEDLPIWSFFVPIWRTGDH